MNIEKLELLVNNFKKNPELISSNSNYKESDTRSEFIDPFFKYLGWDMDNSKGLNSFNKEVKRENFQKINEEESQIPDYIFKIKDSKKIIVEAKKSSKNIKNKKDTFQVRQYGYSAGLPISVLTNFKQLRIFDTKVQPDIDDSIDNSLIFECEYTDYKKNLEKIKKFLGRENIETEEWYNLVKFKLFEKPNINNNFLRQINDWRIQLATQIKHSDNVLDLDEINYLTQKIINRFIFIRVCEDRELTEYGKLNQNYNDSDQLVLIFEKYNKKFNSDVFKINNEKTLFKRKNFFSIIKKIIDELYHPISPYNFAVLYAEFFGDIYEDYLINVIKEKNGKIILEKKDEYLDKDIVSTPTPMVNNLTNETLKRYFEQKKTLPFILDPAVGSGRFLLHSYDFILQKKQLEREILLGDKINILKNLYGIDKDYLAIDTVKFSLYMKILEDEDSNTISNMTKLLPNLNENIIFGNSVIDIDFKEHIKSIQPLNWEKTFKNKKFDIIIGNPPYVKTEDIKKNKFEYLYLKDKYQTSFKQFDKYFSFIEKGLNYLNDDGFLTYIVPSSWINQPHGKNLRKLISKNIYRLLNFGDLNVFNNKSNYTCILYLKKKESNYLEYFFAKDKKIEEMLINNNVAYFKITKNSINFDKPLILFANEKERSIWKKIHNKAKKIDASYINTGIQTSKDQIYIIKDFKIDNKFIYFSKKGKKFKIEKKICVPYLEKTKGIKNLSTLKEDSFLIFPYELDIKKKTSLIQLQDLKNNYPLTYNYFEEFKSDLVKRDISPPLNKLKNDYYKFGRAQNIFTLSFKPKIILTTMQRGDKYYIDKTGIYYTAGGTAGHISIFNKNDKDYIYFLLGLLNQSEIEFFFEKRGSHKAGGYTTRGKNVLSDLPVPIIKNNSDQIHYNNIIKNVKKIIKEQDYKGSSTKEKLISKNQINFLKIKITESFTSLWQRN